MRFSQLVFLLLISLFFLRCNKAVDNSKNIVFFQNQKASWIQDKKTLPKSDAEFYLDDPAPLFRKTFFLEDLPQKATLHITAAGYYKSSINAIDLEKNILDF